MANWMLIIFIINSLITGFLCNTITSPEERTYVFKAGDSLTLKWTYQVDSQSEFVRIDCGRVNLTLSASQDQMETLVFVSNSQPIQVSQPSAKYAEISGTVDDRTVRVSFKDLKTSASGQYKCVLRAYHRGLNGLVKVDSRFTELTTVGKSKNKDDEEKIIIGILVGGIGLIIIIAILGCILYRRSKSQKSSVGSTKGQGSSSKVQKRKVKNNNKKVTKDDIKRTEEDGSNEHLNEPTSPGSNKTKSEDGGPNYAQVHVVSTPDEALNRPYYDDGDMKEYV